MIEGDFLELPFKSRNGEYLLRLDDSPPNGKLTVGLAVNRAFTTLSFNSSKTAVYVSQWKAKSTLVPASQIQIVGFAERRRVFLLKESVTI